MAKFTKAFWVANSVELLERLSYYALFISLTFYLSNVWGFSDAQAGIIAGLFSALIYFLPTFVGAYADKIGFRSSLMIAFSFLTIGYFGLGILPTLLESAGLVRYGAGNGESIFSDFFRFVGIGRFGETTVFTGLETSSYKWSLAPALLLIVTGGAFIKSVITGTVARETTADNRAKAFSIFYMMVNIGSFTGKTVVDPLRRGIGDQGLVYLSYFSAVMTLVALIVVFFLYKSSKTDGEGKSFAQVWEALKRVCTNGRLVALTIIVAGFWTVQQQMYATMPKYVTRMVGESANPGWIANVNPLVVALCVYFITFLMKRRSAFTSIIVGMFIIPVSALIMATGNLMGQDLILGMHPVTLMLIIGIAFQALAECFISPRYLEYFSLQAPKGEEGLYLGFSHLHSTISSILGFFISGFLLEVFCPNPLLYPEKFEAARDHAHYIWYVFFGIGLISAIALIIYGRIINRQDKQVRVNQSE